MRGGVGGCHRGAPLATAAVCASGTWPTGRDRIGKVVGPTDSLMAAL